MAPSGFTVSWLLVIVFAVMLLAIAGTAVVIAIYIRLRKRGDELARCGECGYAVVGLTRMFCPECGSDLRDVGIIPAGKRNPPMFLLLVIPWTIVLPIVALIVSMLLARAIVAYTGTPVTWHRTIFITGTNNMPPIIEVQVAGLRRYGNVVSGSITTTRLSVDSVNPQTDLIFDHQNGKYWYNDAKGQRVEKTGGIHEDVIFEWLDAIDKIGVSGFPYGTRDDSVPPEAINIFGTPYRDTTQLRNDARDILQCVNEVTTPAGSNFTELSRNGGLARVMAHPTSMRSQPTAIRLYFWAAAAFWFVIWLAGMVLLWRKTRPGAGQVIAFVAIVLLLLGAVGLLTAV